MAGSPYIKEMWIAPPGPVSNFSDHNIFPFHTFYEITFISCGCSPLRSTLRTLGSKASLISQNFPSVLSRAFAQGKVDFVQGKVAIAHKVKLHLHKAKLDHFQV